MRLIIYMNYHHIYHAGNFADVVKHVLLVTLIQALLRKEKPFCYLDTHAGAGRYDLHSSLAQKTHEYETGIGRILKQKNYPIEIEQYLSAVKALAPFYPGSPRIVRPFLRAQDRMQLAELHPQEYAALKQEFHNDKQVTAQHIDGYQALKAWLPPKERRGLVLIDPPYEQADELDNILKSLKKALSCWQTGIYAIWYPLKDKNWLRRFQQGLQTSPCEKLLIAELSIYPEDTSLSLYGTGMAILNPPWQFDIQLNVLMPWLWQVLSPNQQGAYRVTWLNS